jgi:hypothetical protein
MFCSLFAFRRLLATSFLLVFVNALAGQCYCASLRPTAAQPARTSARPVPMALGHACCRAAANAKRAASRSTVASHQKHPAGADDCCRKKVASVVAGLNSPAAKLLVGAPALLPGAVSFSFRPQPGRWNPALPVQLVAPRHLPPKIPDIRICIQSLTV